MPIVLTHTRDITASAQRAPTAIGMEVKKEEKEKIADWVTRQLEEARVLEALKFPVPVLRCDAEHVQMRMRLKMAYSQKLAAQAFMVVMRREPPIEDREGEWKGALEKWQRCELGNGHATAAEMAVLELALEKLKDEKLNFSEPQRGNLPSTAKHRVREILGSMTRQIRRVKRAERPIGFTTMDEFRDAVARYITEIRKDGPSSLDIRLPESLALSGDADTRLLALAHWLVLPKRANRAITEFYSAALPATGIPSGACLLGLLEALAKGDDATDPPGLPEKLRAEFGDRLAEWKDALAKNTSRTGDSQKYAIRPDSRPSEGRMHRTMEPGELSKVLDDDSTRRTLWACHALGMCANVGILYRPSSNPLTLQRYHLLTRYALPGPAEALNIGWLCEEIERVAGLSEEALLLELGLSRGACLPKCYQRGVNDILEIAPGSVPQELERVRKAMWLAMEAIGDPVFWARQIAAASEVDREGRDQELRKLFDHMIESVYDKDSVSSLCATVRPRAALMKRLFRLLSARSAISLDRENLKKLERRVP